MVLSGVDDRVNTAFPEPKEPKHEAGLGRLNLPKMGARWREGDL